MLTLKLMRRIFNQDSQARHGGFTAASPVGNRNTFGTRWVKLIDLARIAQGVEPNMEIFTARPAVMLQGRFLKV